MNHPVVLGFDDLTLGYDRHPAVHHLCATLHLGCMAALVGPNGAGKSTLLKGIMGQLKPLEGRVVLNGVRRDEMAYLPQQSRIDKQFPISVWEFASMGLWRTIGAFKRISTTDAKKVDDALTYLGLDGFETRLIGTLSGGQMQRLLFARLWVQDAKLLLLDEPFNGIDQKTQQVLLSLLTQWHRDGKTMVAVLHDLDTVSTYFPETLLLARQLIAFGPTSQALSAQNLEKARLMQAAFDDRADACKIRGASTC